MKTLSYLVGRAIDGRLVEGEAQLLREGAEQVGARVEYLESVLRDLAEYAGRMRSASSYANKVHLTGYIMEKVQEALCETTSRTTGNSSTTGGPSNQSPSA